MLIILMVRQKKNYRLSCSCNTNHANIFVVILCTHAYYGTTDLLGAMLDIDDSVNEIMEWIDAVSYVDWLLWRL